MWSALKGLKDCTDAKLMINPFGVHHNRQINPPVTVLPVVTIDGVSIHDVTHGGLKSRISEWGTSGQSHLGSPASTMGKDYQWTCTHRSSPVLCKTASGQEVKSSQDLLVVLYILALKGVFSVARNQVNVVLLW
ncbi:hypothetical protein GBF38_019724, partial [Nibea albiflora]